MPSKGNQREDNKNQMVEYQWVRKTKFGCGFKRETPPKEMTTEETIAMDQRIPQWKRDLILRRRAVGRVLPTGSGSVQLTCPSVVAAVRFAEYSVGSDFLRRCDSEREQSSGGRDMRLSEQTSTPDDFAEPCVILDIKEIITKIESGSGRNSNMGEEKSGKKLNNSPLVCDKRSSNDIDDNASDSSEEFKYGPGIVSKLKSKYLSLTLRESQGRNRPPLDSLRRAASLENILDSPETEKIGEYKSNYLKNVQSAVNGTAQQRCRSLSRVNKDSMKRARSVEVLTRNDRSYIANGQRESDSDKQDEIPDRRKIRNRISNSSVEEKELPPPDLVKHTLKLFEASQNQTSILLIKKNQKTASDCAKKSIKCPKPFIKQSTPDKTVNKADSVNSVISKKISDKKSVTSSEQQSKGESETSSAEKRKPISQKDKSSKTVINDNQSEVAVAEDSKKSSIPSKGGLSLDLTDSAILNTKRASPVTLASPKSSDKLLESPEPKRCISPVLVRAPPCILSSELGCSNSPGQHMKQVGVIRPIITNKTVHSNLPKHSVNKPHLTEREIEKNLINKVKSIEQPVTKVIVSLKKSPEECFAGSNEKVKSSESLKKGEFWDKKPNTMVFNFSNRKTIPDYIENDGLILAPRREKPKLEPGIIFLGGSTEDSSTDFDLEDLSSDSPFPCDIIFEGDNILINGKSNIQSKPKLRKMKIQFNDEATTLFEYPSEASLLDDAEDTKSEPELSSVGANSPGLPNPFRCSNLASYTPSKLSLAADFELGVTKTAPPQQPTERGEQQEQEEEEEEEEQEECLRPADDSTTVLWSAETAADLLF